MVAFLTIAALSPGHTLVIPRQQIDQWTDADSDLLARCVLAAQQIGIALRRAFGAPRVGLVVAGFEVAHLDLHVFPAWSMEQFDWRQAVRADDADLDAAAATLRHQFDELRRRAEVVR